MALNLRPVRTTDTDVCADICFRAFKEIAESHGFPRDMSPDESMGLMQSVIGRPDIYGVVAEDGGRTIGSNFLWLDPPVAGVGPITIDPAAQNAAAGRALMLDVMGHASRVGCASVRLVQAAYHNRSLALYTKLGFEPREPLSLMGGEPLKRSTPGFESRAATAADVEACNALCARVHGHARGVELCGCVEMGWARVVERGGRITGYVSSLGYMGHAVAESNDDLKALIAGAPSIAGLGFLVPTRNGDLLRWCLGEGLRIVQPMTLMSTGLYSEPKGAWLPSVLY